MTVTVATIPDPAIAGRPSKLLLTASAGNFVRVWCTDAPRGSKLRNELDKTGASRVIVVQGVDSGRPVDFTADKGGAYVFRVEEFNKGAASYGGGYEGDPNGAPEEDMLSVGAPTIYFAAPLVCKLGTGQDTAELLIHVHNETIVATTDQTHGVVSPILRSPASPKARIAADSTTVRTLVAALVGVSASTALGNVENAIDDLRNKLNAHLIESGLHDNDDTVNEVLAAFLNPSSLESQKRSLAEIRRRLDNHVRNDNPEETPPGTGSGDFHTSVDWSGLPLPGSPSDQNGVLVFLADAHRAYEAHRLSETAHTAADTANPANAASPLVALHSAFVAQLAAFAPDTPPNEHPAKATLINGGGFTEA